ncbi:hypothetical protein [Tsuneonella mangrovi]|uniref:hypothetical protein n=1 Tax=Tsuneonella mangrovi TaxID=1982042 RepID=UPI000BA201B2|nr:hypothetical protein [Tsuneonella mangrovi]
MDRKSALAIAVIAGAVALAGCRPSATDHYVERVDLDGKAQGPHVLKAVPDVTGAVWAESKERGRLVYGQPGKAPLVALACTGKAADRSIELTRFAETDPDAKAMMALIGNGHVERFPIDTHDNGRGWLWQGAYPALDPALDVLTGSHKVELTIPGASTVVLNPSTMPGQLIEWCRRQATDDGDASQPELKYSPESGSIPVPKSEPTPPV